MNCPIKRMIRKSEYVMSILEYFAIGVFLVTILLSCVYYYKLPKIKSHNAENDYNLAIFNKRNLIREEKSLK